MRIAVAGATGNVGARNASFLERAGHEVIPISRSLGVDLIARRALDAALRGVDAVVPGAPRRESPYRPDDVRPNG